MRVTKEMFAERNRDLDKKLNESVTSQAWLESEDKRIRKEFAKAFGWRESSYGYTTSDIKFRTPSWEEIFVEVGKLLAGQKEIALIEQVNSLQEQIYGISGTLADHITKE